MLTSSWLGDSAELRQIDSGGAALGSESSEEVIRRVQGALLALEYELPSNGVDGTLNDETLGVIQTFKSDRGVLPADTSVDAGTLRRLDYELSYREGTVTSAMLNDLPLIKRDPLIGSILDRFSGRQGLEQLIIDTLQLGDKFCFRLSFVLSGDAASAMSKFIAEPAIFTDYCKVNGPCTADFFDRENSFKLYQDFLRAHNPGRSVFAAIIGKRTRPDILSHRPGMLEWYEIKPQSTSGIRQAVEKEVTLTAFYTAFGFPYVAGTSYAPTKEIFLQSFIGTGGEGIDVYLDVVKPVPGLVFWSLCLKGDYVKYFNRVRLIAGSLAILLALAQIAAVAAAAAAEAAEAGAVVTAVRGLAVSLGLSLEVLRPRK